VVTAAIHGWALKKTGRMSRIIWCPGTVGRSICHVDKRRRLADHPCTDVGNPEEAPNPCIDRSTAMCAEEAWRIWLMSLRSVCCAVYGRH
jgi:hypothetical protein